jgi:hypothetical protein
MSQQDPNQQPFTPGFQPQWQAPKPPKKKHTGRNIFLAIVGVVVVTGIAASFSGSPSGTPTTTETTLPNVVTTTKAKPSGTPQAPVKRWVKLATVTGSADKTSDTITTTGGKVRISYKFTDTSGYGSIVTAVYLLNEGTDLNKDGGIPDVTTSTPGSDSIVLRKDAGPYYLKVMVANARYTVTVSEER